MPNAFHTFRHTTRLTLPERHTALMLNPRAGIGVVLALQLEDRSGLWAFADGSPVALAVDTLTLAPRTVRLTLVP